MRIILNYQQVDTSMGLIFLYFFLFFFWSQERSAKHRIKLFLQKPHCIFFEITSINFFHGDLFKQMGLSWDFHEDQFLR